MLGSYVIQPQFGLVPLKEMAFPKATVALMPQLTVALSPLACHLDTSVLLRFRSLIFKPILCTYHNLFISQQIVYILHLVLMAFLPWHLAFVPSKTG